MPSLLGTGPAQVSVNSDLGKLAFMDEVNSVSNNPWMNTDISDVKPTLLLDFANSKTLDPRITYTRASTASYYDGKTTTMAEQNLFTYSEQFDNAAWTKSATSTTANVATAPDGTTTADKLVEDTSASAHVAYQAITTVSGTYTYSVYAKAGERSYIVLYNLTGAVAQCFDLSLGTVGASTGTPTSTITSVGNGWYRCSMTHTATAASNSFRVYLANSNTVSTAYTGDGASGLYIWGAQLEQRSSVSSYTPTTSTAITNYIPALQTAAAGIPRFDHDPITGESKGFLIEEQRSNLAYYSSDFSTATWSKSNTSVTPDTVVSPDGTLTADRLTEDSTSTFHFTAQASISFTSGTTYTFSVYAKARERSAIQIVAGAAAFPSFHANFDLSNGTVGSTSGTVTTSIAPAGNGWYRCSVSAAATVTASTLFYIGLANSPSLGRVAAYQGDGYSGLYIWGAQCEAGSFPTSYIPTVASQVTRSADAASMTGTNFSSWYNQAESSLYVDVASAQGNYARYAQIYAGGTGAGGYAAIERYQTATTVQCEIYNGAAANIFSPNGGSYLGKHVLSFGTSGVTLASNGSVISTTTSSLAAPVNASALYIGQLQTATQFVNGTIKKLAYYPVRLSNAELQEMTE